MLRPQMELARIRSPEIVESVRVAIVSTCFLKDCVIMSVIMKILLRHVNDVMRQNGYQLEGSAARSDRSLVWCGLASAKLDVLWRQC